MKSFRELMVWQKSIDFVTEVYDITTVFPEEEKFGLTNQIRRASVSIPSNIAEGYGRKSDGDFSRFLSIAIGSNYEVQTQLEIAKNVGYLTIDDLNKAIDKLEEIDKMLKGLKAKLK
ncbi:four helix bundle protein [Carboxylicivirga linearis]|uniref:Four helix bundle protein n=1 Tax=Carboxylicivirga linearis TaxID=1628157 RepID=A0ABS5JQL3_9BACT|nr:four helix bundle protein [Carboxylicivirga linearis]MBS2097158.1 four helix bundle protein [Carboxylicivirga linearis]